jgi:hypothetical protein
MEWLFEEYIGLITKVGVKAGFETRNLPYLVERFDDWGMDLTGVVVAAPFNKVGFQMCPSAEENEKALRETPDVEVVAFSVLAAGRLGLVDAVKYVNGLPNIAGVAVGVSNREQAVETFSWLFRELR